MEASESSMNQKAKLINGASGITGIPISSILWQGGEQGIPLQARDAFSEGKAYSAALRFWMLWVC
jgi:hypothetical protein